ncbi:MAG: hypothetical protein ACRDE8_02870, partial [Ginsengibacter sp.]
MTKKLLFVYTCLLCMTASAQKKNSSYIINIYPTNETVRIDGIASENVWKSAEVARDFFEVLPMDTS